MIGVSTENHLLTQGPFSGQQGQKNLFSSTLQNSTKNQLLPNWSYSLSSSQNLNPLLSNVQNKSISTSSAIDNSKGALSPNSKRY